MELFEVLALSTNNPTLFEAIAIYLFPYGTHAARPAAANVPLNAIYYETDTTDLFQNQAGTWVQIASIGGGGGGGGLTLVEHKSLTASAQDVTFSGLDGDTDGIYVLKANIKNANAGTAIYSIQPNGVTTNQLTATQIVTPTGTSQSTQAYWYFMGGLTTAKVGMATVEIQARKVQNSVALTRHMQARACHLSGGVFWNISIAGEWNESSTNITNLVVHSDVSNGNGDGSEYWLYKYEQ
jgi:hypothetical protein